MNMFEEKELRDLLSCYEVNGPSRELVTSTRRFMREELLQPFCEPLKTGKWVFLLVVMTVAMSLCLFYMLTVGTILWFVLPSNLMGILRHTQFAFAAAGGSVIACALMVLYFKRFCLQRVESIA
jgi:hypothetical protein